MLSHVREKMIACRVGNR